MPPSRLSGKVAIVTGSSSGIGRAIALEYGKEGAVLACADLQAAAKPKDPSDTTVHTHDLINQREGKAIFVKTDVSSPEQVKALVDKAVETFGRLDVMVNNAGVCIEDVTKGIHEIEEDVWEKTLAVNLRSVFAGCKYAIAQMMKQEPHSGGKRGWIVNMSSGAALVGMNGAPAYTASKGAVTSLTRQIAISYASHQIRCNAICPGLVNTSIVVDILEKTPKGSNNLTQNAMASQPLGAPIDPSDIAKSAVFLASDDAQWITGVNLPVDGGYVAM